MSNAQGAYEQPIGCVGRVSRTGAIRPGRTGEVLVTVGGSVEAYMARDADGGAIEAGEEVVVVDRLAPRTVLVSRLDDRPQPRQPLEGAEAQP